MHEHNFIKELEKGLSPLPPSQREDVLADYRAHIFEARERGKTDEEISASLGDPKPLARTFSLFFLVLGRFWGWPMGLGRSWVGATCAVFVGIIFAVAVLIGNIATPVAVGLSAKLALSFYSLSLVGASLLACVVLYLLSRWFLLGLMKYIKLNAKVIQPD